MPACQVCMKFWVVFMSLIFMLVGTVVMALSVYLLTDPVDQHVNGVTSPNAQYLLHGKIFILVSGCLLLLGGIVGCCGGFRRSSGCLSLFLAIVTIIAIGQIAAGIFAFVRKEELIDHSKQTMIQLFYEQHKSESNPKSWDFIQENWQCCGVRSYKDYQNIKAGTVDMTLSAQHSIAYFTVPTSCCIKEMFEKCENPKISSEGNIPNGIDIFQRGCWEILADYFEQILHYLMYTMIAILSAELFCLMCSCILIYSFRSERYSKY